MRSRPCSDSPDALTSSNPSMSQHRHSSSQRARRRARLEPNVTATLTTRQGPSRRSRSGRPPAMASSSGWGENTRHSGAPSGTAGSAAARACPAPSRRPCASNCSKPATNVLKGSEEVTSDPGCAAPGGPCLGFAIRLQRQAKGGLAGGSRGASVRLRAFQAWHRHSLAAKKPAAAGCRSPVAGAGACRGFAGHQPMCRPPLTEKSAPVE